MFSALKPVLFQLCHGDKLQGLDMGGLQNNGGRTAGLQRLTPAIDAQALL